MRMKTNSLNRRLAQVLATGSILLACLGIARADTLTWWGTGTTANWSDSINWTNSGGLNAVPANGDNLVFSGFTQTANNNDLAGLSPGWIQLSDYFTVSGNFLTLGGSVTNLSGDNVLGMNVTLGAAQVFANNAPGTTLTFDGTITNGGNALTVNAEGNVTWTMNATRGIKGSGDVIKTGGGTLTYAGAWDINGSLFYFTGNTYVYGGTMVNNASSWNYDAQGSPVGNVTVFPGATFENNSVHFMTGNGRNLTNYGGTVTLNDAGYVNAITLSNGVVNVPSGDIRSASTYPIVVLASDSPSTIAGNLNLNWTRTFDVANGAADPDLDCAMGSSSAIAFGANTGGIVKTNSGKMQISGPALYTGSTVISGGTLALGGSGAILRSPLINVGTNTVFDVSGVAFVVTTNQVLAGVGTVIGTVNDSDPGAVGSAISPGGSAVGTLAMDGLSLSGNSLALSFNLANVTTVGGGVNDLITCTNLTLSSGNTNTVNFTFSGTPSASPYTLITFPLGQGPAAGPVYTLAAPPTRSIYTFTSTGTSIQVTVSPNPAQLVWRGDGTTNTWDLGVTTNWMNGLVKDAFLTGDNATFNDSGSNTPPVNLVGALPANIVTVAGTKDYTFAGSGKISGGARLNKTSSGTLTILTANDNAGGGSLSGGVVNVGNVTVTGNLGSGNLTNNTKVNFNQSASSSYAGNMSGSGSVNAFVPGATLSFTGTNTFTGGLTIQNGTVQIGNNPTVAGASVAGPITNYGVLYYSRTDAFTNQNNVNSDGNTYQFSNGEINIRGNGGMTVDGTASLGTLGNFAVSQGLYGKLTVNPGGLINVGAVMLLGNPGNIGSDVFQNGGTINITNHLRIGHWGNNASTISSYYMNGGTLNIPNGQVAVGWDGVGLMLMTNGTVNCVRLTVDDSGINGALNGTNSTFTMRGGQLNIGTGGITSVSTTNQFVPTVNLSGGTIAATAPAGFSSSLHMWLTNGTPTFDTANSAITLSGVLKGNGGLTKAGTGILNVNGANTYTGTTTVGAGTLQGTGTIVGPVTVQSGASLSAGGTLGAGTLTLSNVTVNAGAGLTFDLSSTAATGDQLIVKGPLALDAATPVTLNFLGGTPFIGSPYTLITNWDTRSGALAYANPTRYAYALDQSNPKLIQVTFTGANANLVWKGNVNNLWNLSTTANWLNGGVASTYYQSDNVIFDDNGVGTPSVSLASDMTPASVTVNSSGNYSFAGGGIGGVGALTKSGSGTLTVANNLTHTGGTVVSGGTLQVGTGSTTGSILGNIADYSSVVFNRSDTVTYSGIISGPGTLTQAGSGKLLITAANTFFGGTTINPGSTVQVGNGPQADAGVLGNGIVTNNGAVIFYRTPNIGVATPYTGAGSLTFLGTGAAGQSGYSLNATNTFTGPVTLNYARIQSGAGALSFGSPSSINVQPASQVYAVATSYSPVYNIPLTLAGTGWQDGLGALRIENGGTWAGPISLANNARIGVNNGTSNNITGTISGAGYELETYGGNAGSVLVLAPSAPNTYSSLRVSIGAAGATTIAGNANAIPDNIPLTMNGGTLKLNGFSKSFAPFYHLNNSSSIQNGSASSTASVSLAPPLNAVFTYGGTFANGGTQPLNVTFNQTGPAAAITMNGDSSSWTGNFTNNGGTITVASTAGRLGPANVASRTLVFNNCTFNLSPNNAWSGGGAQATMVLNNSTLNCTRYNSFGPFVLNGSTLTGNMGGSDSAYYAQYNLTGGKVTVIGTTPSTMAGTDNGTANSRGYNLQTPTVFDVANVTSSSAADLTVTAPLRPGGAIGGSGALIKTGAGTMLVTDAATYTGSTVITNGVLAISGATLLNTSSSIDVGAGATLDASAAGLTLAAQTLKGSGTVVGSVTDGTGSVIAPGSGVGTLTVNGDLALYGGGSVAFELSNNTASGNDRIQVNGALTLIDSAPTPVNFTFVNGAPAVGTYTLINFTSLASGSAAGLTNTQGYNVSFAIVGNSVRATFAAAPAQSLVWQGGDSLGNNWDITVGTTNWFNGTADTNFIQLDTVRFDDSRTTANTTIAVTAAVNPASITFDSTNDYVFNGAGKITGVTTITKNNTNTVTLGVVNDAIGTITVNAGMLKANSDMDDSYDGATLITVKNGGAFNFDCSWDNRQTVPHNFVIEGAGPDGLGVVRNTTCAVYSYTFISNMTLTADSVLRADARWDIGPMAGSTVDGGYGNNFKLIKTGAEGLGFRPQFITNLSALVITNGRLWHENYDRTNTWDTTITNYATTGGRLGIYGGRTFAMPVVLDAGEIYNEGGGTPTWNSNIRIDSGSVFNNGSAQNFYGQIYGPGAMWVDGGRSALTITNPNTYVGGTIVSNAPSTVTSGASGTAALIVGNASALGSGPLSIDGGAFSSLATNAYFFTTNVLRPVEFNITGGGTVLNAINLPGAGPITNVALQGRDSTSVFTLAGKISGGYAMLTNWVDFGNAGSLGVMRLSNPLNDFVARTIYVNRGILGITADGVLGNSANLLRLDQANRSAGLRFDAAGINIARNIQLQSASAFDLFGDNDGNGVPETVNNATISGIISGAAGTIDIRGTNGVLTLTGVNTYSGSWELVQPAVLQVASSANLGTAAVALKAGTLRYTGAGTETMTRSLWNDNAALIGATIDVTSPTASLTWNPAAGTCNQPLVKTGAGALTLGTIGISGNLTANGGALTVNSVISGGSTILQVNTGTVTLAGANTYGGGTLVNSGTLFVNGSLPAANTVRVASGGTLAGNGTINCPVDLQAGSALQPGVNNIGTLTIKSPLALSGTTTTTMEINGTTLTGDQVASLSTVTYGGTLNVVNLGATPPAGTKFTLFSAVDRLGSFTTVNLPPATPPNYWTNLLAIDGSIQYMSPVSQTPVPVTWGISGGNLNLSWPADHTGWRLLVQTNALNVGLVTNSAAWTAWPNSENMNSVSIPVDSANGTVFYKLVYP